MAIYHQDIAEIELNGGSLHRSFLNHSIGLGDAAANRFGVRIFRDGVAETLSGVTCQGFFRNANGENIALTSYGTIDGNVAYVTLPQACYNVEGVFTLAIKLVGGGVTGTMRIVDGTVDNTNTGSAVAPTGSVPTYQEVLSVYEQMQAAVTNYNAKVAEQDGKISDLKSAFLQAHHMYNFELGTFSSTTDAYKKTDSNNQGRNIVPFFADKGVTIATKDNSYEFYMLTFTPDTFTKTGATGWVKTYTLANPRFCYLVFRSTTANTPIHIPADVESAFTTSSIATICNGTRFGETIEDLQSAILLDRYREPMGRYSNIVLSDFQNGWINVNGQIGSTVNLTPSVTPSFVYLIVDCAENDIFTLTGRCINVPIWAFVDSNNNLISKAVVNDAVKNKVIIAPANSAKLILNFHKGYKLSAFIGNTTDVLLRGAQKTYDPSDAYIYTNKPVGDTIYLENHYEATGYGYIIDTCTGGDKYTISGEGANSGRLWAFIDSNNKLLAKAGAICKAENVVVTAPEGSKYFIANFSTDRFWEVRRGDYAVLSDRIRQGSIMIPTVHDLPKELVEIPEISYRHKIQNETGVSGAKCAIFKNSNNFCITYGENLDGTADDFPEVSTSGTLALKYKYFKLANGVESPVNYGTIAQKGSTYIDRNGNTATFSGGCGLPSGRDGIQYFVAASTGTNRYNGKDNYGMIPCCCSVAVDDNGVTFGTIHEMTLTIDSESGAFDVTRIDPDNVDYYLYITTAPPCKISDKYYWLIPGKHSIIVLRSDDAISWTLWNDLQIPFEPKCEITSEVVDGSIVFAVRVDKIPGYTNTMDTLYVGCMETSGLISCIYKFPFVTVRAWLTLADNGLLLFYTPYSKNAVECLLITYDDYSNNAKQLHFLRWFTLFGEGTWYMACEESSIKDSDYTKMYIAGGNDPGPSRANGMSFVELTLGTAKAREPSAIGNAIA